MSDINEPRDFILNNLCRGYISSMFGLALTGKLHAYDSMRVDYHHAIERFYGMRYDSEESKKLNRLFHGLNSEKEGIGFPIPEHAGYGDTKITKEELAQKYVALSNFYGDLLYDKIKRIFGTSEQFLTVKERFHDTPPKASGYGRRSLADQDGGNVMVSPAIRERNQSKEAGKGGISFELAEHLAALEHEQWMEWSKVLIRQLTDGQRFMNDMAVISDNVHKKHQRWLPLWVPYDELSEEMKEEDRKWARKVLTVIREMK